MNLAVHNNSEVAILRDRLDLAEEENRQLKALVYGGKPVRPIVRVTLPNIHLAEMEERILYCLSRREFTTHDQLWYFLYGHLPIDNQPQDRIIKVYMTKIRKKVRETVIQISNVRGRGHSMSPAGRELVQQHAIRYDGGADA